MVVTNNKKDYDLLKIMRAHGWDRDLEKNEKKSKGLILSIWDLI